MDTPRLLFASTYPETVQELPECEILYAFLSDGNLAEDGDTNCSFTKSCAAAIANHTSSEEDSSDLLDEF
jgi:hypothetical protein